MRRAGPARAGRHRLPAGGPAAAPQLRARQPGRARRGRGRQRPVRHRGGLRRLLVGPRPGAGPGRRRRRRRGALRLGPHPTGDLQRRGGLRRRRAASAATASGCCPNYSVFDEQRYFTPGDTGLTLVSVAGVTVGVSICEDAWTADGPDRRPRARRRRPGREPQRLAVQRGQGRGPPRRRRATGPPSPAPPSPTSTRSAARTSSSSTATRWSSAPTARVVARAAQFTEGLVIVDVEVPERTGRRRASRSSRPRLAPRPRPVPPSSPSAWPPGCPRSPRCGTRWCSAPATSSARTASPTW